MTAEAGPPARTGATRLRRPDDAERGAALAAVRAHLAPTPIVRAGHDRDHWLKLETLQPTGSFKVRGAIAALSSLPPGIIAVSASAGNHALGLAWASTRLGVAVTVVVPETASPAKLRALERVPGRRDDLRVVRHGPDYETAEARAHDLADEPGHCYVSAYSDWAVIAGQSTIGDELDAAFGTEVPIRVVTPLGGGGLASGLACWAAGRPGAHVAAVEVAASPSVGAAVSAGRIVPVEIRPTIADGLGGNLEAGSPTPAILGEAVAAGRADIVDVEETEVEAAIRRLFATNGIVAEGAGAAAAAHHGHGEGLVVTLVTGRNITPEAYAAVLAGG